MSFRNGWIKFHLIFKYINKKSFEKELKGNESKFSIEFFPLVCIYILDPSSYEYGRYTSTLFINYFIILM